MRMSQAHILVSQSVRQGHFWIYALSLGVGESCELKFQFQLQYYYKDFTSDGRIEFPIGHHETIQLFPQGSCSSEVQSLEIIHTGKKTLILQTYLAADIRRCQLR